MNEQIKKANSENTKHINPTPLNWSKISFKLSIASVIMMLLCWVIVWINGFTLTAIIKSPAVGIIALFFTLPTALIAISYGVIARFKQQTNKQQILALVSVLISITVLVWYIFPFAINYVIY